MYTNRSLVRTRQLKVNLQPAQDDALEAVVSEFEEEYLFLCGIQLSRQKVLLEMFERPHGSLGKKFQNLYLLMLDKYKSEQQKAS